MDTKKILFFSGLTLFSSLSVLCPALTPEEGLQRLLEGNKRYVNDKLEHPDRTAFRREALVSKQKPFATILGCADSRVSPEIIFDQGIGDLFVVRVAGNVLGSVVLDSLEFASLYLGSSTLLVLGHENCGAVAAVLENQTEDIEAVADLIRPAIRQVDRKSSQAIEEAIKANVISVVQNLKQTPTLKKLVEEKKLNIIGGYYKLASGEVELIP